MSTPVQNEIIKTKEELQARTSHAITQEMNVYRGMILNYVWNQTALWTVNSAMTVLRTTFKKFGSLFQTAGAAWQKARLANAVLGAVLHRTRWVDGLNCLVGWLARINDDRYPGCCVVNSLRVSRATLYVIRALIGSQCRAARTGVMLSNFAVHITTRAREFWSLWSLSTLDFDVPYKRLLQ